MTTICSSSYRGWVRRLTFLFSPMWLNPAYPLSVQSTRALAFQRPANFPYLNILNHFTAAYMAAADAALRNAPQ
eukprot:jgi/Botrbrau1/7526/Bobra.0019s0014.1